MESYSITKHPGPCLQSLQLQQLWQRTPLAQETGLGKMMRLCLKNKQTPPQSSHCLNIDLPQVPALKFSDSALSSPETGAEHPRGCFFHAPKQGKSLTVLYSLKVCGDAAHFQREKTPSHPGKPCRSWYTYFPFQLSVPDRAGHERTSVDRVLA